MYHIYSHYCKNSSTILADYYLCFLIVKYCAEGGWFICFLWTDREWFRRFICRRFFGFFCIHRWYSCWEVRGIFVCYVGRWDLWSSFFISRVIGGFTILIKLSIVFNQWSDYWTDLHKPIYYTPQAPQYSKSYYYTKQLSLI